MLDDNSNSEVLLELNNIEVIYNHVILVLKGVSLTVHKGGITALLGGNGAGKTTTLKAISNLLRSERGEVTKGSINYRGEEIQESSPSDLVRSGVIQVMEGRHCFEHLTVEENIIAPPSQVQYVGTSEKITQARNAIIGNLINWNGCKLVISARE